MVQLPGVGRVRLVGLERRHASEKPQGLDGLCGRAWRFFRL